MFKFEILKQLNTLINVNIFDFSQIRVFRNHIGKNA